MRDFRFFRRKRKTRSKIFGTKERPRMSVFRSNREMYAQLIDDNEGKTLVSMSSKMIKKEKGEKPVDIAEKLGISLAKEARKKKIKSVVFDKSGYKYYGRIKSFADGARKGGLEF